MKYSMRHSIALGAAAWVLSLNFLPASAADSNLDLLRKIWDLGRQQACSGEARGEFSEPNFHRIHALLTSDTDRAVLASALNPFLFSLGYSHTQLFTEKDESYFFFRGIGTEPPQFVNPGLQVGQDDRGHFAREVLHGSPAERAGILKGDRILRLNGNPFQGTWGKSPAADAVIRIARAGGQRDVHSALPAGNWSQAFQEATLASIRVIETGFRRVGYVRLWSGVHPESAKALWTAVDRFRAEGVDGVVLDLRGGYGGAFWEHLDPFFPDRSLYFSMSATDGNDRTLVMDPAPGSNPGAWLGPLVVLVNEGSRSGKEALAYQFKKTGRAPLVGTATPGYFSGGRLFFNDEPEAGALLYLCVMRDSLLDGHPIEGIGITPDVMVGFRAEGQHLDAQLEAALAELERVYAKGI
jgi:carboxyl-terminal processing protease